MNLLKVFLTECELVGHVVVAADVTDVSLTDLNGKGNDLGLNKDKLT